MTAGQVVIVGASIAGLRAAQTLRDEGYAGRVVLIGAEPHLPYDRPPLSKDFLAGRVSRDQLDFPIDDLDAEFRLSTVATGLDLDRRRVILARVSDRDPERGWNSDADAEDLFFDGVVIATGAHPRRLPGLPDLDGVFVLRTVEDALALADRLASGSADPGRVGRGPRVAVVGAGFIGSEVAATCRGMGLDVTVIEALPVPMVRALGELVGRRCARLHTDHGVGLRLGVGVIGLAGDERVEAVLLADGTAVPAEVVVVGVGVAPTTSWLNDSGLDIGDGVLCDRWCRALTKGRPATGVVAAGDVARWDNPLFGESMRVEHWTNAAEQGRAAALTLLHGEDAPVFDPVPYFWSDQYETKIQFVGRTGPDVRVVDGSLADERFVVIYGSHGRIVGALAFSRPARLMAYRSMIARADPFPTS